jgi:hypothetical protein
MTMHSWTGATDDELDAFVRAQMAELVASTPVPALHAAPPVRRRRSLRPALSSSEHPRRLAPLAVAVGVAVLLAGGSGTWLAMQRLHGRSVAPAVHPTPLPSVVPSAVPQSSATPATPAPLASTVPAGVNVVYWADWGRTGNGSRVQAVDWSGHPVGSIDLPADGGNPAGPQQPSVQPSPNGQVLLVSLDLWSSSGRWLGRLPHASDVMADVKWTEDSRHLCRVAAPARSDIATLEIFGADGAPGPTTHVHLSSTDTIPHMLGCAAGPDRAMVTLSDFKQRSESVVQVDLASGKTVWGKSFCTGSACGLSGPATMLSPDGRYLAYTNDGSAPIVEEVATGHQTRLSVRGQPTAFTGDSSQLLISLDRGPNGSMSRSVPGLRLLNWRTGVATWSRANGEASDQMVLAEPGGVHLAVAGVEHGPSTGVFPSGPMRLDLITVAAASSRAVTVADPVSWGVAQFF